MSVSTEMDIKYCCVRGNEDFASQDKEEDTFFAGNWTITAIHGHQMDINPYHSPLQWQQHFNDMVKWAISKRSQVFLFGHSHRAVLQEVGGIVICNPGDQYIGSTGVPTFAVINAEDRCLTVQLMERLQMGRWTVKATLEKIN
ncbi:MAG: hypothetical protein CVU52_04065 [Deltaproteobacteria bacterium HGW-Deltaproteobacteria-10]|nr:MAG: hypothetical protein CVU52_04065 [Deltaproteobacteria bacterium HGW-Deltaproteobacteria-10]